MKSPAGFAKAPPKPAEVRRQGRNIRARQDAERDAAASDFYSQLGGDGKEANRLRMRERVNPGYTETRARQLPEDRETYYRQRTLANQRRLTRSQDFYRQPEPQPSEPAPTVVADTPAQEPVTGRVTYLLRQGAMDLCSIQAEKPLYLTDRDAWEKALVDDAFQPPGTPQQPTAREEVAA